jgi:DNA polymerase-3 subunit delta'
MLARAIERDHLHHCLLLLGPAGIGKRTLARGLACALTCPEQPGTGCGQCTSCVRIQAGNHPDFVVVEGEGKSQMIKVGAANRVIISTQHAPFEAPAHVVVFDAADNMHEAAANKLLKTIEEPRPAVHFILLAENRSSILPTILSRSLSLALGRLDPGDLEAVVESALEGRDVDPERRRLAIELADGVPGRAVALADDPSLPLVRTTLAAALAAVQRGAGGVFSGDAGPLWSAWKEAVRAAPDPDLVPEQEPEPDLVVVKQGGRKRKSRKPRKKKAKAAPAWGTPAQQRATALRLTELWLIHLRERMRGRPGLVGLPALTLDDSDYARHAAIVLELQGSISKNPNVRLALEHTVLRLSGAA